MTNLIEKNILKLLSLSDGTWSWYRLDRELSRQQLGGGGKVVYHIAKLERDGLVRQMPGNKPSMPFYVITDRGRAEVEQWTLTPVSE